MIMSIGFWQIAIVVILVVLLFGRGKISGIMGDVAKGIKSFKKGMSSDVTDDKISSNIADDNKPNIISEENKDSTNKE
jgi:sec-independent protein translocase protein TatA